MSFIVPLKGDKIETKDGVSFDVLSYTNYRDRGPAVYVEHTPAVPSDAVYFFDIARINGVSVEYVSGAKVFRALGSIKRKFHLPQPGDMITTRGVDSSVTRRAVGLKLHRRGDLAKGLQVQVEERDTEERELIRLDAIIDLQRDIGNDLFSREKFLSYYNDYRGTL